MAHCAAQGKVGSGFDVAAAVYGSCIYRRFDPNGLEDVLLDTNIYNAGFRGKLRDVVNGKWEMEVTPFKLPKGLRVVMGDVAAGSATPSMVRSVLKWKASHAGAAKVWADLGDSNRRLIELFNELQAFSSEEIVSAIRRRDETDPQPVNQVLVKLAEEFEVCLLLRTVLIPGHSCLSPSDGK